MKGQQPGFVSWLQGMFINTITWNAGHTASIDNRQGSATEALLAPEMGLRSTKHKTHKGGALLM